MKKISEIDSNFKVDTKLDIADIKFYDIENEPFEIYGVKKRDGIFSRMPYSVAEKVNDGVKALYANSAGGRVRFTTDSSYVAINVIYRNVGKMPHFAFTGSIGFDMYVKDENGKEVYERSFVPPVDIEDKFESVVQFGESKSREITINFPTYSTVEKVCIGIADGSSLGEARKYKINKPIVYYGSSITQGGCSSRPGNSYESIVSRRLDADYINLGFSGNAKGETVMADYIKELDMSVFVLDYDHNAPSLEHLEQTHEKFFKIIREAKPNLPIVMLSAPIFYPDSNWKKRRDVIETTYNNAVASGDKNVYFIDGKTLMKLAQNDGTVDNCHPNDLGFYSMAQAVGDMIEKIIGK